jgi:plastocyanin
VIAAWGQAATIHNIDVADFQFTPSAINVRAGDTLRWNWVNGLHTVTSGAACTPSGLFNAPISSGSPVFNYVIPHSFSGLLPYHCVPHCTFSMEGSATVVGFPADVNGDGVVNITDLLGVIAAWGACP